MKKNEEKKMKNINEDIQATEEQEVEMVEEIKAKKISPWTWVKGTVIILITIFFVYGDWEIDFENINEAVEQVTTSEEEKIVNESLGETLTDTTFEKNSEEYFMAKAVEELLWNNEIYVRVIDVAFPSFKGAVSYEFQVTVTNELKKHTFKITHLLRDEMIEIDYHTMMGLENRYQDQIVELGLYFQELIRQKFIDGNWEELELEFEEFTATQGYGNVFFVSGYVIGKILGHEDVKYYVHSKITFDGDGEMIVEFHRRGNRNEFEILLEKLFTDRGLSKRNVEW